MVWLKKVLIYRHSLMQKPQNKLKNNRPRLVLGFRVIAQTNRDDWVLTESATAHISLVGAP